MSAIEQFTYTASPWGKSDPGWMTFQKSLGIDDTDIEKLSSYYRYGRPDSWDGAPEQDTLASYPIQFVFARPAVLGGDALLVQTTFTGKRWYDPRPGDWFVHGFRIASSVIATEKNSAESLLRLFKSDSIQREYPQELREKATLISQKKMQWEAPPDLPSLNSLDDLEQNLDFSLGAVLRRMPDGAWPKLGGLLAACVKRESGAKAFVFNATQPESLDTMVALLALMPSRLRMDGQFSTYFHAENVREIKADETFLFYGAVREGETCDAQTGLYGEPPQGGPEFRSLEDVDLFKRMVDAGGEALGAEDFDNLVFCWEVAAGRKGDVESLRQAVEFAKRFDGMSEVLESGLSDSTDSMVAIVGWFEQGLARFEDNARQVCSDCVSNGLLFTKALQTLEGEGPQAAFADTVFKTAQSASALNDLAEILRGCNMALPKGDITKFVTCVNRMVGIRQNVNGGLVLAENAASMLEEIGVAENDFGSVFGDMEETRNALRYLVALDGLHDINGLATFAKEAKSLGIDAGKVRTNVLERVNPGEILPERLPDAMTAFEAIGLSKEEVLRFALNAAEDRGRIEGERSAKRSSHEWHGHAAETVVKRGVSVWLTTAIAVAALLLGLVAGVFLASLVSRRADVPEVQKEKHDEPPVIPAENAELPGERERQPERPKGSASRPQIGQVRETAPIPKGKTAPLSDQAPPSAPVADKAAPASASNPTATAPQASQAVPAAVGGRPTVVPDADKAAPASARDPTASAPQASQAVPAAVGGRPTVVPEADKAAPASASGPTVPTLRAGQTAMPTTAGGCAVPEPVKGGVSATDGSPRQTDETKATRVGSGEARWQ